MSEREYEELANEYAAGRISRRRFIGKMVAGGMGVAAAVAFASDSANAFGFFGRHRGHSYGHAYGRPPGVIYGAHRVSPPRQVPARPIQLPFFSGGQSRQTPGAGGSTSFGRARRTR